VESGTDWFSVKSGSVALSLELALPYRPANDAFSLMLSVGMAFGTVAGDGTIVQVGYAGSARVLAVG
jgi:hypothetical protein